MRRVLSILGVLALVPVALLLLPVVCAMQRGAERDADARRMNPLRIPRH